MKEQDIGHEHIHTHTHIHAHTHTPTQHYNRIHSHTQARSQRLCESLKKQRVCEMRAAERSVAQKQRSESNLVNTCLIKLLSKVSN